MNSAEYRRRAGNWWHYHRLWVLAGCVGALLAAHFVWSAVTAPRYDLRVAVLAREVYPDPVLDALAEALALFAQDCNGDGRAAVEVVQYVVEFSADGDTGDGADTRTLAAGAAGLQADLRGNLTQVFLLADPDGFSRATGALRYRDGTLPADGVYPTREQTCYRWQDCPVLTALDLGSYDAALYGGSGRAADWYAGLYIGSRGFWQGTAPAHPQANEALWQALTAGADEASP